jgi:hypothetical protein
METSGVLVCYPRANELLDFDDTCLASGGLSLPAFLRSNATQSPIYSFSRALLLWRALNFRLLMFHPFVVWLYMMRSLTNPPKIPTDPVSVNTAIARCLETAENTIARCRPPGKLMIRMPSRYGMHSISYSLRLWCPSCAFFTMLRLSGLPRGRIRSNER